ncbi:MAG: alpha-E domain-containing protein, partial [Pseudomonadota bacterium]|nr:alpha-E domain-containing protein [Pseudomonadota bacterium]
MLGRTASSLYWLCRYMERAENMARLLDVGYRMSLDPGLTEAEREQWDSTLQAAATASSFFERYDKATLAQVRDFMLFDEANHSSVRNCLLQARSNARSVRTAITTEMWESVNTTWLEFSRIRPSSISANDLPSLLDWIKRNTAQFRGAMLNTILRDDGYCFCQIGTFTERADNTARIMDVKYFVLLPRSVLVGSELDNRQWSMILRAASAHRSYRHVYRDRYKAWNIADFLILRSEMPRSLAHCYEWISSTLDILDELYGTRYECHDIGQRIHEELKNGDMDVIFQH